MGAKNSHFPLQASQIESYPVWRRGAPTPPATPSASLFLKSCFHQQPVGLGGKGWPWRWNLSRFNGTLPIASQSGWPASLSQWRAHRPLPWLTSHLQRRLWAPGRHTVKGSCDLASFGFCRPLWALAGHHLTSDRHIHLSWDIFGWNEDDLLLNVVEYTYTHIYISYIFVLFTHLISSYMSSPTQVRFGTLFI